MFTMSVRSDDSESSDLTLFYCIDCDTRHELGSDAPPFVCGVKYSSDEIYKLNNLAVGGVIAAMFEARPSN
jgi:hypothetical protein